MRAGADPPLIQTLREQLPRLDPVQIGSSGQVKEFREERKYGEIGESHHRHISHLVGLYPGSCITRETPEWMAAAKVTLNRRGDKSTGWAMAHRINLWARTGRATVHINYTAIYCASARCRICGIHIPPSKSTATSAARQVWPKCSCKAMQASLIFCLLCQRHGRTARFKGLWRGEILLWMRNGRRAS